jgi:hypothetical protein
MFVEKEQTINPEPKPPTVVKNLADSIKNSLVLRGKHYVNSRLSIFIEHFFSKFSINFFFKFFENFKKSLYTIKKINLV